MTTQITRHLLPSRLLRQNLTFFSGSLLVGLFGYVFQFASGRLLGLSGYSVVASAFAFYNLVAISLLVVLTITMRHTAALHGAGNLPGLRYLFRRLTVMMLAVGVIASAGYVALSSQLALFLRVPQPALLALAPAIAVTLAAGVNRGTLQGLSWFGRLSAVITIETAGRAALAAFLILLGFRATGALAGVSAAMLLGYGLGLIPLRHLLRGGMAAPVPMRHVLSFAMPTVAAVGGITFLYNADIVLVGHYLSNRAGVYASAATLGRIVYFATYSITGVMFPRVSAQIARGESATRTLQLSAAAMCAIAAVLVAGFAVLPNLALLPFGSGFLSAAPYLPVFGLAMALLSIANLLANYLLASGNRTFIYVLGGACIAEVAIISNFHQSIWQVLWAVLVVLAMTVSGLVIVYLRSHRVPGADVISTGRNT